MVTSKQYDLLNRLTNSSSSVSFVYAYNSANQRSRATLADGSYWVYAYDSLGQVISGRRYWSDGTAVAGQQFEYSFDTIGNRQSAGSGGDHDQYGGALHYGSYWANSLNQYTSRDVPGYVNVIGSAKTNATVSLWTPDGYWAQTSRKSDYFRGELPINNSTGALWLTITNLGVLNNGTNQDILTNTVGNAFVARTPEAFGYDADGNLTSNGRFTITWDAENRALSFASLSNAPSASKIKVDCTYDWLGRRTQKIVSTWNGSAFVPQSTNGFVYDGWNLIAVLNGTNGLLRSFTWGLDLSGSLQGAGGVGGLLAVSDATNGVHFMALDGNGNVAALVKASDGTVSATYEYGPFGELVRATGPVAKANPFRFSTKYQDDETDQMYYGYRYYSASMGRWVNRDPLNELGFRKLAGQRRDFGLEEEKVLFAFAGNDLLTRSDSLGLSSEADVFWAPPPCPRGQKSVFIQILYGGWGPYSGPRTDDGSAGFSSSPHGCPDYPLPSGMSGTFQDSPSGVTGPVQFIVCRVCLRRCCPDEWRIASIGPCVYWKKGDKGDLSNSSGFTIVSGPPQTWEVGLQANYPSVARGLCYKCDAKN